MRRSPSAEAVKLAGCPSLTVWLSGCVVIGPIQSTVSVAAFDVTLPAVFVNTARYSYPFCECTVALTVRLLVVVPASLDVLAVSVVSLLQLLPSLLDTCHCTLAAGLANAAAVNDADWPSSTVTPYGCPVTGPIAWTVSVAAVESTTPTVFVNTARYS